MFDLFSSVQWTDVYSLLTSGQPPLILQLLAVNTVFFILTIIKAIRSGPVKKRRSNYHVQEILIVANVLVLYQDQILPYLHMIRIPHFT